jgi:hypothetical protein
MRSFIIMALIGLAGVPALAADNPDLGNHWIMLEPIYDYGYLNGSDSVTFSRYGASMAINAGDSATLLISALSRTNSFKVGEDSWNAPTEKEKWLEFRVSVRLYFGTVRDRR